MARRKTKNDLGLIQQSIDLHLMMDRSASDVEFHQHQESARTIAAKLGNQFTYYNSLSDYQTARRGRSLATLVDTPQATDVKFRQLVGKIDSVRWYLGRFKESFIDGTSEVNAALIRELGAAEEKVAKLLTEVQKARPYFKIAVVIFCIVLATL